MSGELQQIISEAFFFLFQRGYFVPISDGQNTPTMTRFYMTQSGVEWFKNREPLPEDSATFMEYLGKLVPNLDPIVAGYVQETLTTYNRQAFFAAAVMLGAAAEKAVYRLAEALEQAARDPEIKKRFHNAMVKRGLPALFELVQQTLDKATIDYEVQEGITQHLLSLFEAIRVQRNDAVHPKVGRVTPETVRLTLAAFPLAISVTFGLIAWLEKNQI